MSDITMDCDKCQEFQYMKGRADVLTELLSKDWWNPQQRMVMEDWLKQAKEQNHE